MSESNAIRTLIRNALVTLGGAIVTLAIGRILFQLDKPNPPLALLLLLLLCCSYLSVGYFATRIPALLSGIAFFLGSLLTTVLFFAPAINPDTHRFPLPTILKIMRGQLVYVAIACALGYVGAWIRKRFNKRSNPHRSPTR
jgi:hypothetical protein